MWNFAFILFTVFLFLIPLLPALKEWLTADDNAPLRVVQEYDGNVKHFAGGFRQYLQKHLAGLMSGDAPGEALQGVLSDGTPYQIVPGDQTPALTDDDRQTGTVRRLVIGLGHLTLPNNLLYEGEVYSRETLTSGYDNYFRALLAEGDIKLAGGSKVLRWLHGNANIMVESGAELFGRLSCDGTVRLAENCRFERIFASRVEFGAPLTLPATAGNLTVLEELEHVLDRSDRRWLISGNLELPARHIFTGDLVTRGSLSFGDGFHLQGSAKSNKDMALGAGVTVEGSIVSAGNLFIGPNCRIHGPVISERAVIIHAGAVIGAPDRLTTISAPEIYIDQGVVSHGTIWAGKTGFSRKLQEAQAA